MKVYVVIGDDPDTEPVVQVFYTPEKAIAYAKECVAELGVEEHVKERYIEGRLYCCTIGKGHQGATIYVEERELNAENRQDIPCEATGKAFAEWCTPCRLCYRAYKFTTPEELECLKLWHERLMETELNAGA